MMQKEFNALSKGIKKIEEGKILLFATLIKLLSRRDKIYKITIDKRVFEFRQTFTEQDHKDMNTLRIELIDALIKRSFKKAMSFDRNAWSVILSLAQGVDPIDLQIEKYQESESYEINDEHVVDGDISKGIQLAEHNAGSWVMKQQLTRKARNHNPVTGKPFKRKKNNANS